MTFAGISFAESANSKKSNKTQSKTLVLVYRNDIIFSLSEIGTLFGSCT